MQRSIAVSYQRKCYFCDVRKNCNERHPSCKIAGLIWKSNHVLSQITECCWHILAWCISHIYFPQMVVNNEKLLLIRTIFWCLAVTWMSWYEAWIWLSWKHWPLFKWLYNLADFKVFTKSMRERQASDITAYVMQCLHCSTNVIVYDPLAWCML